MKIGFIGVGNMASSIIIGGISSGYLQGEEVFGFNPPPALKLDGLRKTYGVRMAASARALAEACDIIVLSVKPHVIREAVEELGSALEGKALVSIALGWRYEQLSAILPKTVRCQHVMPNTPAQVKAGVAIFEEENSLEPQELSFLRGLFESIGTVRAMPARLMDAAGTLTGCGPAFVYQFIEALADGAVYHGVPRKDAYALASAMVSGAAQMVLQTGLHPGELKDNVCSPGGSTIRGVTALEEKGFRAAVIEAIHCSTQYEPGAGTGRA